MKKLNVIIIGSGITSLYTAIKCLDIGYKITIIERNNIPYISQSVNLYNNYNLFNENHKSYINLLKRFSINYEKITTDFNNKLFTIINTIIERAKHIPNNILITHTFTSLGKQLLTSTEMEHLYKYDNFFNIINAVDCINIFTNDINNNLTYYYVSDKNINDLINKMITYIILKNGKLLYNIDVKNITYQNNRFILTSNNNMILSTDILISTLSKNNLLNFNFWNSEQRYLLNSVSIINSQYIKTLIDDLLYYNSFNNKKKCEIKLRNDLLLNIHVVFPLFSNKSNFIYIWNNGYNNIIVREKIRNMYNNRFFIYSESYSKNNMFINYSIEYIDSSFHKL